MDVSYSFSRQEVKDQDWQIALFQDLASSPATLDAARIAHTYSCFPDHTVEGKDVEQAYLSAELGGTPTYVTLPKEMWTPAMHKMRCPVVRLRRALYGHKNSGVYWARHCEEQVKNAGFLPVHKDQWPCCYWHAEKKLFLIVYVDDMLLAGPKCHMAETWEQLSRNISLSSPPGTDDTTHAFLGCTHRRTQRVVNGKTLQCSETDVSHMMRKAIAKYEVAVHEATGKYPRLFPVKTPFEEEETKYSPLRAPKNDEDFVECPVCMHTWPVSETSDNTYVAGTKRTVKMVREMIAPRDPLNGVEAYTPAGGETASNSNVAQAGSSDEWWSDMGSPGNTACVNLARGVSDHQLAQEIEDTILMAMQELNKTMLETESNLRTCAVQSKESTHWNPTARGAPKSKLGEGGRLGHMAAMMLMTLLHAARAARSDLLQPIQFLAKRITRWDDMCDKRLHRLMCYIYGSVDYVSIGWIGDDPSDLTAHLFCDASFASCPYTLRSTGGDHCDIQGPNSHFPWSASSQGQTATAQSSTEAEIAAMNKAMKEKGEAALTIWNLLLKQYHDSSWSLRLFLQEDNTACIQCASTGKNQTMKTLERGFGVNIGWNHDRVESGDYVLVHTRSTCMSADIYTKGFSNPVAWTRLRRLINIYTPAEVANGCFNPEADMYAPKDIEGIEVDPTHANPTYTYILAGDSILNKDPRKAVKKKTPKAKAKAKAKYAKGTTDSRVGNNASERQAYTLTNASVLDAEPVNILDQLPELSIGAPRGARWTIILLCTEPNSYMQQNNPFPENCDVIDITKSDDFTSEAGFQKVADILATVENVVLLISFPCTAGCLFNQGINAANPKCKTNLEAHWEL